MHMQPYLTNWVEGLLIDIYYNAVENRHRMIIFPCLLGITFQLLRWKVERAAVGDQEVVEFQGVGQPEE